MQSLFSGFILALSLFVATAPVSAAEDSAAETATVPAEKVTLPKGIVWETNDTDPIIGSEKAIRGGTFTVGLDAYPLTFRVIGPNSNDYYAAWNRQFAQIGLVSRHPVTDNFIPILATHWSIQDDHQTIFFKLDPDAKFSDGHPITADDYVFTWHMMQSKFIVDPFMNSYAEQYFKSVDKVDDYTLRIVGTRPSWRPLADYAGLWPTPAHATKLDKDWVERTNNEPLVVPGPYVLSNWVRGESVTFKRIPNWWGDKKRYFIGQNNFDEIHLRIVPADRELDYLRQGDLDLMQVSPKIWNEGLDFPAVQNGWIRKARVFYEWPSGISGLQMNTEAPIFQNKDFRTAVQYLLNFDRINRNLLYSEYFRKRSFFDGTEYANPDVHTRPFDPAKAREYLARAGFHKPAQGDDSLGTTIWRSIRGLIFTRTDTDDILVNGKGEKATFTTLYYAKIYEPFLTTIQQDFRRAGIDMRLQFLEPGAAFQRGLERKFEALVLRMTNGLYPDPRQYLGTEFKNSKNNNDFWGYGTEEVDGLIKTYEENLDAKARLDAMYRIDQIVHDEAFYLPFWDTPYLRLIYWDYLQFPDFYLPRRTEQYTDWLVYWIDPKKKAALAEAMRDNKPYPVDPEVDKDYYHVRDKLQ